MTWAPTRAGLRRLVGHAARRATSDVRIRPSFLIIGGMKCGTSSLFRYVNEHPGVLGRRKEIYFFDRHYGLGRRWYRGNFPTRLAAARTRRRTGYQPITGEATPYYLFHPLAPRRAFELLPDAKLVALLRDPVDRAYSHYHYWHEKGDEPLPFEEAVEQELERLGEEERRVEQDPAYAGKRLRRYSYLARGRYLEQIERWLAWYPREQLLVLATDDLARDPAGVYERVIAFLGLPAHELADYPHWNTLSYAPMSPETRASLAVYFEEHNRRLYEFLGRDLGWTTPATARARAEGISRPG